MESLCNDTGWGKHKPISIQVSGYVRQTQQYLLKYIKNETLITRQVLELQFKYEP